MPRLTTRRMSLKEERVALGIAATTFVRSWQDAFTDVRAKEDRRKSVRRPVLEDELSVSVKEGRAAVLLFRKQMGRL